MDDSLTDITNLSAEKRALLEKLLQEMRDGFNTFPLSYAQQRLWFLDQLDPDSPAYNIAAAVSLKGLLDNAALQRALDEVIKRHEALRTSFSVVDGKPVQLVAPQLSFTLSLRDLSTLSPAERDREWMRLAQEEVRRPFDLSRGPLLRAQLLRLWPDHHLLLFTMHHIVSDGWSMGVLVKEVAALYAAFSRGEANPLAPLPIQYADYALWQREWLTGQRLADQLSYWQQQLTDAPVLELPTDYARPAVRGLGGAQVGFRLPARLSEELRKLSRREGATLYMVLLAAFKVLLWRYSGQADVVVGTAIAGRTRGEVEDLIGFFVNTLAVRTKIDEAGSFLELLREVKEGMLGAYGHQEVPFEMVVEAVQPERRLSHTPLFQVMFAWENTGAQGLELAGLGLEMVEVETATAKFDITLAMSEEGGESLGGKWEYSEELFAAETIKRMSEHYQCLLESIVARPEQAVTALPLLPPAERHQLLVQWNQTEADYPRHTCIHQLFEAQAQRTPEAVALISEEVELSYGELNRRANQVAHYLRGVGVEAEASVGICMERSVEMVVALLGILKAGGAYLPLDSEYPSERLSFMLEDAGVSVLLTQQHLLDSLPEYSGQLLCLDRDAAAVAAQNEENPVNRTCADNLAYIIYTSGSTGTPKGVEIPHRGVLRLLCNVDYVQLDSSRPLMQFAPLAFDASTFELWGALLHGATCVLFEGRQTSPRQLEAAIDKYGVRTMWLTASLYNTVMDEAPDALSKLEQLLIGGEPLSVAHVKKGVESLSGTRIINGYGPTESTTFACCYRIEKQRAEEWQHRVPIGKPISNTQLYVLDGQLEAVPIGVAGELYIGGDGLARGYLNRAELTAEKFIPDLFSYQSGARLYRTGDLARYRPDGQLDFLGRRDHQVKVRGYRIELGEVETALLSHAQVREAIVVVRQESGDKRLVAYLVTDATPTVSQLREHLKEKLPDYMVPSAFVMLGELPLTPNGKVDRRALPEVESRRPELGQDYVRARSGVEEVIAGIWGEVLEIEQVGVEDNFFELGGHSLLATQLMSRVRESFGVELALRKLFEAPTVAGLAAQIEQELGGSTSEPAAAMVRREREGGEAPLSFAQQRLWFLDQLDPGSPVYNISVAVSLSGQLDVAALTHSLQEIVQRHEVLRTHFVTHQRLPAQLVAAQLHLEVPLTDLSPLTESEREAQVRHLSGAHARQPFDLSTGPLLRAHLLRLADTEHLALLTMHHIVSDGWSMGVLVKEVAALYAAFSRGEANPLAPLPIQYADYALWQREWLTGQRLADQLSYWQERLADAPVLELPTDYPRPPVRGLGGAQVGFRLPARLSEELRKLSRREGATLYMVLLAAFKVLLWRYSGQADVMVGTAIAGRTRGEVEDLIGFFVNTLAVRTKIDEAGSFLELLREVKEGMLGAYGHQEVPFEMVVEAVQPERQTNRTPLFQVFFNMLNFSEVKIDLAGLTVTTLLPPDAVSKFDLTLYAREESDLIEFSLTYNTELFEQNRMVEMLEQLGQLLSEVVAHPEAKVSGLSLLTSAAQTLLPNPTEALDASTGEMLYTRFTQHAGRTPTRPALVDAHDTWSYRELNCRSNQLADFLLSSGVKRHDVVAIYGHRSASLVWAVLGVLKAGAAFLILDPAYPSSRLADYVNIVGPAGLLQVEAAGALPSEVEESIAALSGCCRLVLPCLSEAVERGLLAEYSPEEPDVAVDPGDLAYIAFTSGSTGNPKGIAGEHRPVSHFLQWYSRAFALGEAERFSMLSGLAHDPLLRDIFAPLWLGATLCIPGEDEMSGGGRLTEWMKREQVSVAHLVPAMIQLMDGTAQESSAQTATHPAAAADRRALEALRYVFFSGDVLTARDTWRIRKLAPSVTCVNFYGTTETPQAMGYFIIPPQANDFADELNDSRKIMPVGQGIDDVQLLVLNASQRLAGIGELGEIYVRTPYLSRGYVGNEALTGERFILNPFTKLAGDRLYRTGDLGRYRPDGQLDFLGRRDLQVKVRGYRIELGEIEAVLTRHPNVRAAVVIALEDGTGDRRLVAYVVPADGVKSAATVALWRAHVEAHLPGYMMPSAFVMLAELPLTPNGKVDRRALLELDISGSSSNRNYVAPRTAEEEILAEVMAHLLKAERVGVHDNFFELGGHSLLAMQLMSRVRESFGVELALRKLFEAPTVAGLAAQIEQELKAGEGKPLLPPPPVRSVAGEKELPLSFAQERLWFQDQLQPGNPFFNLHQAFRLTGELDVAALELSLNEVIRRHDALRTIFKQTQGPAIQIVRPAQTVKLPVTDLRGWPESERESEVRRQSDAESNLPFDLATGPLLRVRLLQLEEEEHVVLLTMHHIVSDGWSVGIFIREMALFYESFSGGPRATPAELPFQYADIAAWQRQYLQGEALEQQLSYWRTKLDAAAPALSLPTDYPRPPVHSSLGARRTLMLPDGLVRQLKEMNRREGVTLFISMLAALKIVLFKWTQQRDLVVGTVVANRNKLETENLIGCFMNFLPVRSQLTGDETGRELLEGVKASVLEMYAHQDCPFEKIVEAINPERRLNQNPLYNVAFLLQNFPRTYVFSDTLEAAALPTERHTSLLDLRLVAEDVEGGLQLWCEYSTDLFAAETIESFLDNYYKTLEKFAVQTELSLSSFELSEELANRAAAARRREEKQTVVIASTFTAEPVGESVAFWMQQLDIPTRLEFAPYNQPFQQLLDPSSLMGENENGVNVLLVRMEDWSTHRNGAETKDHPHANGDAVQFFSPEETERNGRDLIAAVSASAARTSIPHLLCLCPASPGLAADPLRAQFLAQTEEWLASEIEKIKGAYVVRASELAALYPVANYYDPHADHLGHIPYTQPFFTALGTIVARKIHALRSAPYKVLVMDCDDTLWKGVCGEDGAQGIELDDARRVLQEFVVAQHDQGMLICLCSKNNEEDVFAVFRCRTEMPLRREHLTAWRVNWQPKSESIKSLAAELNLGLESFILIDNDPVICMEVQANCPEVLTIQLPAEIERIPRFLQHIWAFDRLQVTDEDRKRTALYQQKGQREHLRNASLNLEGFLAAIELKVRLAPMQQHELARVAQLTERTNQFNVSAIRRSESEIERLCRSGQFECLVAEASDRFGDYGLVGVVIFTSTASNIKVDTFLLSCRAMGRTVEHRMLAKLGAIALERGLEGIEISFRPTAKNQPARDFLESVRAKYQLTQSDELTFNFPAADAATLAAGQTGFAPPDHQDTGAQSSGAARAVFAAPQE